MIGENISPLLQIYKGFIMTIDSDVQTIQKVALKEPELFDVIVMNDDKTPMDFVTEMLIQIFNKSVNDAQQLMLTIHHKGAAVAGTYVFEIAEQKAMEATAAAQEAGFPLVIKIDNH